MLCHEVFHVLFSCVSSTDTDERVKMEESKRIRVGWSEHVCCPQSIRCCDFTKVSIEPKLASASYLIWNFRLSFRLCCATLHTTECLTFFYHYTKQGHKASKKIVCLLKPPYSFTIKSQHSILATVGSMESRDS